MPKKLIGHTKRQFNIPKKVMNRLKQEAAKRYTTQNQLVKDILIDWLKKNSRCT